MVFVLNQANYLFKRNRTANLLGYKQVKGAALVQCGSVSVLLLPTYPPTPDSEPWTDYILILELEGKNILKKTTGIC